MKNILHNNDCLSGSVQIHMYPPHTHLIKRNIELNSDHHYIYIKLRINPTLKATDMYDFKIALFDNGKLECFFLKQSYQMVLEASGNITVGEKSIINVLFYVYMCYINSELYVEKMVTLPTRI